MKISIKELRSKLPPTQKECRCEQSELGYHNKDCTFFPHGWNSYRRRVLSILNKYEKNTSWSS